MQYLLPVALLAFGAAAAPSVKRDDPYPPEPPCLTYTQAQDIAVSFIATTSGQGAFNNETCQELLSADFSDTSSSVASVGNSGKQLHFHMCVVST